MICTVPRPGFPLYQVIAESHGASVVHYDLLPDKGWECDLNHMESIILGEEQRTKAPSFVNDDTNHYNKKVVRGILLNNPSNPTGAVYSEEHLMQIATLAGKYQIPIIADEIYGDMTFGEKVFYPMANVASKLGYMVPVITASGLGKQCGCLFFLPCLMYHVIFFLHFTLIHIRYMVQISCQVGVWVG